MDAQKNTKKGKKIKKLCNKKRGFVIIFMNTPYVKKSETNLEIKRKVIVFILVALPFSLCYNKVTNTRCLFGRSAADSGKTKGERCR